MTAKNLYEAMLIELNKVNAPSLLLEDYNYFINKAVNQYINKRYNVYDTSLQTTDDLRVLKATVTLPATKVQTKYGTLEDKDAMTFFNQGNLFGATYTVNLPQDYLHALNCICIYEVMRPYKCYTLKVWSRPATRLTADAWATVYDNAYMCPTYRRPYYYIHNVNQSETVPTDKFISFEKGGVDLVAYTPTSEYDTVYTLVAKKMDGDDVVDAKYITIGKRNNTYYLTDSRMVVSPGNLKKGELASIYYDFNNNAISSTKLSDEVLFKVTSELSANEDSAPLADYEVNTYPRTVTLDDGEINVVDKTTYSRINNPTRVRCEIRYGRDDSVFKLRYVTMDYIKAPQHIKLTQEQLDLTLDTSQILEFPDLVCQEIINELVLLVLENASDLRVATQPRVSLSIGLPAQQLTQQPQS